MTWILLLLAVLSAFSNVLSIQKDVETKVSNAALNSKLYPEFVIPTMYVFLAIYKKCILKRKGFIAEVIIS